MADQCGPWTLEQLDLFSPSIDALAFSLDDPIWESADTCILDGAGSVAGDGNVNSSVSAIFGVSGAVNAVATVTTDADRQITASADISASGVVVAQGSLIHVVSGSITAEATVVVIASYDAIVVALVGAAGFVATGASRIRHGQGSWSANGNVAANAYKFGEEWSTVGDEANTWTPVAAVNDLWTEQTAGNNQWQSIG